MGCFGFSCTKLDTYVRMRDYLRRKMEERRLKKRLKDLENQKREDDPDKTDVSNSTLGNKASMLSGNIHDGNTIDIGNNSDVNTAKVDKNVDTNPQVDNSRLHENKSVNQSKVNLHKERRAVVINIMESNQQNADNIGKERGDTRDIAAVPMSPGRKMTFGLVALSQSAGNTTPAVEVEDDISAINRRIKKMISEQTRRKAESAEDVRVMEATRYCSSPDFSATMQPLTHGTRSNIGKGARCIRM